MGSDRPKDRPPTWLTASTLVLLGIGFASSVYLTDLYVKVTEAMAGGGSVDSFCNISKGINCESVAASDYSAFLGIPVSVYGAEFFGVAIALVLASRFRLLPFERWDAILFALTCVGVPVTIVLGWLSVTAIQSVCIMCLTVYGANTLLAVLLAVTHRARLGAFVREGLGELRTHALDPHNRPVSAVAVLVVLSQFIWAPGIFAREGANASKAPMDVENAKAGTWLGQPASGNSLGPIDAPIQIQEFTDFQCPFCSRAHTVTLEVVKRHAGKVHLVHRDFPLDHHCNPGIPEPFHQNACGAAFFARCAADQDLYWPFESLLFHNQRKLRKAAMLSFAQRAGLDTDKMKRCIASKTTHEAVLADIKEGIERGISGTPTFFVNGEKVVGAHPIEFWDEKIQALLGELPAASASAAPSPSASTPTSASASASASSSTAGAASGAASGASTRAKVVFSRSSSPAGAPPRGSAR